MGHKAFDILGFKVQDKVSGFKGIATSASFDLYGCVQILIRPQLKKDETKLADAMWLDLNRLKVTSKVRVMKPVNFRVYDEVKIPGPEDKPTF